MLQGKFEKLQLQVASLNARVKELLIENLRMKATSDGEAECHTCGADSLKCGVKCYDTACPNWIPTEATLSNTERGK